MAVPGGLIPHTSSNLLSNTNSISIEFKPDIMNPAQSPNLQQIYCFVLAYLVLALIPERLFASYKKPDGSNCAEPEKKLHRMVSIEYSGKYADGTEYFCARLTNIVDDTSAQTYLSWSNFHPCRPLLMDRDISILLNLIGSKNRLRIFPKTFLDSCVSDSRDFTTSFNFYLWMQPISEPGND